MGLLRSEDMQHATLILPPQDAKDFIVEVGYSDDIHVQFEDMNRQAMRRPFRKYVDRIAEMDRILRVMGDEFAKLDDLPPIVKNELDQFQKTEQKEYTLDKVEAELARKYDQWIKFKENNEKLIWGRNATEEEIAVMRHAQRMLRSAGGGGLEQPLLEQESLVESMAGVVEDKEIDKIMKGLWRASRGKAYFSFDRELGITVKDPKSGAEVKKTPFVAYFQTGPESALARRVKNVCLAMSANMYNWPRNAVEAKRKEDELQNDLKRNDRLLKDFTSFMEEEAREFVDQVDGGNSKIENYRLFCKKEKSAYTILNLFTDGLTYRCDLWFPKSEFEALSAKLHGVKTASGQHAVLLLSREAPAGIPPTYVQTNDFLEPWQGVINTYGIPSYKTANPVVITSVTFPFIFGMMYGDVGHGSMLLCAGLFLIWRGSKPGAKYDFPLYSIRFVIAQMGFFAVFAGLMYNDLFGMVSFEFFESRFMSNGSMVESFNAENLADCGDSCQGPYPFGLDHAWHGAANELLFQNSLKMKLSVCVGVLQMLLGVGLRFSNALHDGSMVDLVCECIPMLIFMVCFFGYMDYMIVYKWTHKIPGDVPGPDGPLGLGLAWGEDANGNPGSAGAPSIINSLICMGMHQVDKAPLFPGAQDRASMLMLASAVAVPWLLIPKPLILKSRHEKVDNQAEGGGGVGGLLAYVLAFSAVPYLLHLYTGSWKNTATYYAVIVGILVILAVKQPDSKVKVEEDEEAAPVVQAPPAAGHGHGHGGEFEFGEVLIHQVIETIEYVLGTISHTASYLRIWALSLAHQQLSAVFYKYTLLMAFSSSGGNWIVSGLAIYVAFGAWIGVTIGVLLGMDVLECFLHTLRLHWVEFQSKFYRGDGQWFSAYNIKTLLMDD